MNKSGVALCVFVAVTAISGASAQSCATCNCQINNIQLLDQLVEAKVNRILANEPSKLSSVHKEEKRVSNCLGKANLLSIRIQRSPDILLYTTSCQAVLYYTYMCRCT